MELKQQLEKYGLEKNWLESKKVAQILLDNFKNSKERETYFNVFALSIINQSIEIRRKNGIPPDTTQLKGTITLYLSEELNDKVKNLYNELTLVVEKYFDEFPAGKFEDSFFSYLISAYELQGEHRKVQEICKKLYNSDKPNLKLKTAFHLGRYAHFQKKYKKAINYYNFIISKLGKSEHQILYSYLIANCYFELKDIENTYKYLNNVFKLTDDAKNNDVRKVAEIMYNHIKNDTEKFNRHFVVFRDPANENE